MKRIMMFGLCLLISVSSIGCRTFVEYTGWGLEAYLEREEQKQKEKEEKARLEEEKRLAEEKAAKEEAERKKAEHEAKLKLTDPGPPQPPTRPGAGEAGHQYFTDNELPKMVAVDNPAWGRTLWKSRNDSLNGAVLLLDPSWMPAYQANTIKRVAICSDPWGNNVVNVKNGNKDISGVGKIVKPYYERPAIRFDGALGAAWRPGYVFIVIHMTDGSRGGVYILPDPGQRVERK
jgi:hypothetical protein